MIQVQVLYRPPAKFFWSNITVSRIHWAPGFPIGWRQQDRRRVDSPAGVGDVLKLVVLEHHAGLSK